MTSALHNCWVHDCGEAFIADAGTTSCLGCGAAIALPKTTRELKIQMLPNGPRYGVELKDRVPIILGRSTMPGLPPTVSARHLEFLPFQGKLLLRHVGSNPSLIQQGGQWYQLTEAWIDLSDVSGLVKLQLAQQRLNLIGGP